jgi:hypothetical protein
MGPIGIDGEYNASLPGYDAQGFDMSVFRADEEDPFAHGPDVVRVLADPTADPVRVVFLLRKMAERIEHDARRRGHATIAGLLALEEA